MVDDEDGRASWRREKNLGNGLKREGEETSGSPTHRGRVETLKIERDASDRGMATRRREAG